MICRGEAALVEAHQILEAPRGAEHKRTIKTINALEELYKGWDAAEPGKGFAAKGAEWRAKLEELRDQGVEGSRG